MGQEGSPESGAPEVGEEHNKSQKSFATSNNKSKGKEMAEASRNERKTRGMASIGGLIPGHSTEIRRVWI